MEAEQKLESFEAACESGDVEEVRKIMREIADSEELKTIEEEPEVKEFAELIEKTIATSPRKPKTENTDIQEIQVVVSEAPSSSSSPSPSSPSPSSSPSPRSPLASSAPTPAAALPSSPLVSSPLATSSSSSPSSSSSSSPSVFPEEMRVLFTLEDDGVKMSPKKKGSGIKKNRNSRNSKKLQAIGDQFFDTVYHLEKEFQKITEEKTHQEQMINEMSQLSAQYQKTISELSKHLQDSQSEIIQLQKSVDMQHTPTRSRKRKEFDYKFEKITRDETEIFHVLAKHRPSKRVWEGKVQQLHFMEGVDIGVNELVGLFDQGVEGVTIEYPSHLPVNDNNDNDNNDNNKAPLILGISFLVPFKGKVSASLSLDEVDGTAAPSIEDKNEEQQQQQQEEEQQQLKRLGLRFDIFHTFKTDIGDEKYIQEGFMRTTGGVVVFLGGGESYKEETWRGREVVICEEDDKQIGFELYGVKLVFKFVSKIACIPVKKMLSEQHQIVSVCVSLI